MILFEVPGTPIGKGRPRFSAAGGFARAYTPARTRGYEALVAFAARDAMRGLPPFPRDTALRCAVEARFAPPASWSARKTGLALSGALRPTVRPDGDNIIKSLDAITGIVWSDDCSVVEWSIRKTYRAVPCLIVEVSEA